MNKKANKKAFFVCAIIGLMYATVAMKLPDRLAMKRTGDTQKPVTQSINVSMPKPAAVDTKAQATAVKNEPAVEPSYFIAIPIVCSAVRDGIIEKEGLVFVKGAGQNKAYCKKPADILLARDEEGLRAMAKIIGKKYMIAFFKKEGVPLREELDPQEVILGRGYAVEKNIIIAMFNKHVPEDYNRLFPYAVRTTEIRRGADGFVFSHVSENKQAGAGRDDNEWVMPNLVNMPMKTALEKLSERTSKIKVLGSGIVIEQQPRALEKIKGEVECTIYGRGYRQ